MRHCTQTALGVFTVTFRLPMMSFVHCFWFDDTTGNASWFLKTNPTRPPFAVAEKNDQLHSD